MCCTVKQPKGFNQFGVVLSLKDDLWLNAASLYTKLPIDQAV